MRPVSRRHSRRGLVGPMCIYVCVLSHSVMSDSAMPCTVACQAPVSMGFFRQEYWNGLPCSSPGDLPLTQGSNLNPLHWQVDSLHDSAGKESACNAGDLGLIPWIGKIPWRRTWQPIPVFLPEKSHGHRSLAGHSAWHRRVGHD